jgi:hypothetical protein
VYFLTSILVIAALLAAWVYKKSSGPVSLRAVTSLAPDAWEHFTLADHDFCTNSGWIVRQIGIMRQKKIHPPFEPFLFEPTDAVYALLASSRTVDLQEFVHQLCEHIKLSPVPTVTYDWDLTIEGSTVGLANLDSIFPKISVRLSYTNRPRELGALLAHEVTHHYLHRASFRSTDRDENERLTDLAAVFLGFGKLMLNGADVRYDAKKKAPIKKPVKLGYLTMADLACAYDKVCCLNGVSTTEWTTHLSAEAVYYVQDRASAREPGMYIFLNAKEQHDIDVAQFKTRTQTILKKCQSAVETLAARYSVFSEGLLWVNQNCGLLRVNKQDGFTMVRMNNDLVQLQDAVTAAQRRLSQTQSLSLLAASNPSNATHVHSFVNSARGLLASVRTESNLLRQYIRTIKRYKEKS